MTDESDTAVDRIPLARSVHYVACGLPEVPNQYGPGVLAPSEITLTYRAAPDSQLGRVHAYLAGRIWADGKELPLLPGGLYGQHYFDGMEGWPAWLVEEARLHDPDAAVVPPADRAAITSGDAEAMDRAIPSRRAGLRDEIAAALEAADYRMDMRRGDLADAVLPVLYREWPWLRAEAEDAAVLPAPVDRAAVLAEIHSLVEEMRIGEDEDPAPDVRVLGYNEGLGAVLSELRRLAAETAPEPAERPRCPYCQMPHDLTPGSGPVLACASIRATRLAEQRSIALDYLDSLEGQKITETDRLRLLLILDDGRHDGPLCGKTQATDGTTYPPCARPADHIEAYCRNATRTAYFIAATLTDTPA